MKNLRLTRIASNPEEGTFGSLVLDGKPVCNTLEPYIRDNAQSVSCIPEGQYICKRHNSSKYGSNIWKVTNVEGRSFILIHWGNLDDHTEGCILTGEKFGMLQGKWAVLESRVAFNELMDSTRHDTELLLTIKSCY